MAAKYADDEPELIKFMSDMGYPKTGEWCGEFAASVIKRAGGTPPSGAAIASNWRGYGAPDAMPHAATLLWLIEVCRLVQQARMLAS
jgi:hypothetical protein